MNIIKILKEILEAIIIISFFVEKKDVIKKIAENACIYVKEKVRKIFMR